ncbi:MAG: hypothetical protein KH433_06315 [Campylobacter concisus]|jgi:hypothetical protein|uniref:Uncharacterized protein n=1 Tax=Campylobacter concisus (strain 13826) TaxID=360104 RepID=A7ZED4_CAMC1|nr:hypothetical protein [Campylobacter concisus]EAT98794.1 hypothetical protein CCC13826_2027 [Campylobacter concisus 13826]MBS6286992.1 hypothetical protein [Campylobacter concisus]
MELILQNIIDEASENFGKEFLEHYLSGSFGSMSKSETEILIFHLLSKHFENSSNYEISNFLKISETKVKNLTLNAHLRYGQSNKDILKKIMLRICDTLDVNFDENIGEIKISVENPVEKRELVNEIKKLGSYADFSFNNEILKIKINFFLKLLNRLVGEDNFKKVFQKYLKEKTIQNDALYSSLTTCQKVMKFLKNNNITPIEILKQIINISF